MKSKSILRSSITNEDGDVDVGYLALAVGVVGWAASTACVVLIGGVSTWRAPNDAANILQSMGIAFGGVSGGFATMLGAVGVFRIGDKNTTTGTRSTTTESTTVVQQRADK